MSKREKIIIGLMIASILYGAFEVFAPEGRDRQQTNPEQAVESAEKTAEKISSRTSRQEPGPGHIHVLRLAGGRWEKDPFYRLPASDRDDQSDESGQTSPEGLEYTGFLETGKSRLAIINGIEYSAGERLKPKNAVVQSISPEKVVIKSLDTGERFEIQYSD